MKTETKHTKGRWVRGTRTDTNDWMRIFNNNVLIAEAKSLHKVGHRQKDDFQTEEANAKLIAAAPDMLEALTDLVEMVSPIIMKMGVKKVYSELLSIEQAKRAIRKAIE